MCLRGGRDNLQNLRRFLGSVKRWRRGRNVGRGAVVGGIKMIIALHAAKDDDVVIKDELNLEPLRG